MFFPSVYVTPFMMQDRIPGCQFLGLITGKENTYFERSLEALGVGEKERYIASELPSTSAFCSLRNF